MAELLRLAGAGTGAVLVVDDAHHIDDASLRLVHHLARSTVREQVLLVLAHRPAVTPALAQVRQSLLGRGRRTDAERHRTLRATIGWSYDLLTRPQQVLMRRLSIFARPFDVAAAGSVAADGPTGTVDVDLAAVGDLLGELVDRSMLLVESGRFGRWFRLLETIREFAAELSADDDSALIAARHAR